MVQKSQVATEHSAVEDRGLLHFLMSPYRFVRQFASFVGTVILVITYVMVCSLVIRPLIKDRWRRVRVVTNLMSRFARALVWTLHARVVVKGERDSLPPFMVSNHMSYIDVVVLSSITNTCFVTSQEMRETPILGQICESGGSLFVERRNRRKLRNEIGEVSEAMQSGLRVTVFPEATSSNGEGLLPFRRPLFRAPVALDNTVQPVCINYRDINGEPVTRENRDTVFWYGDMTFVDHLWNLAGLEKGFEIEVNFLKPLPIDGRDEKEISVKAQQVIADAFSSL